MNWEQLQTIFWLRWRLMRNQWARSGGLGAILAVLVGLGSIGLALAGFTGGLLGALFGLADARPSLISGIWLGVTVVFLLFWLIGLLAELQRSEAIDLQKLMHLPVALGQLFVVNYLVSHFSLSIVIMVPVMLGLGIGLTVTRGPEWILILPLALSMVLMITAWTYCLRGWLASLMSNPRRRRTVVMCITMTFILLAQGPNLYFNLLPHARDHRASRDQNAALQRSFQQLAAVQAFIPPLWVPVGARSLAEDRVLPALYGTLGCLGLAALGLRRAYRVSLKFYSGQTGGKLSPRPPPKPARILPAATAAAAGSRFLEWQFPAVPEQSAALALATFRSLLRAPEVKMALGSSCISILFAGSIFFLRTPPTLTEAIKPFVATGVVAFSIFILLHFFINQFGFDRDGFRSLMLSPVERRLILLGKNLAFWPLGFGLGTLTLGLITFWLRVPLLTVAAAIFQLAALLFLASLGGNLLSILVPFRIQPGSMRPTKLPALAMLTMVLCQLLLPLALVPVFIPPLLELLWHHYDLPPLVPVNLICSVLFCSAAAAIYWLTLPPLGRLLQRRETKILGVVTVEVE